LGNCGSLGVFEIAMLIALPQFPKEELVASLLIFRCLYFVLPLCTAVCLMATRELWLATRK
jgi:glycosyltransferase 2 family protein